MNEEGFDLSEKRGNLKALFCAVCQGGCIPFDHNQPDGFIYPEESVKEFIRLILKDTEIEFFQSNPVRCNNLLNKIKKRAGAKLK